MEIVQLTRKDARSLLGLYRAVTAALKEKGIHQWDWFYPNRFVIGRDLRRGTVFGIREQGEIVGAVVVDRIQSSQYAELPWNDADGAPACIHRLAVHPAYQGKGIGSRLLRFAERHAREEAATSVRLDVYTGNPGAAELYRRAGYSEIAAIRFPMRREPYLCFEKRLTQTHPL